MRGAGARGTHLGRATPWALGEPSARAALAQDSGLRSGARGADREAGSGKRRREVGVPGAGRGAGLGAGTRLPAGPHAQSILCPLLLPGPPQFTRNPRPVGGDSDDNGTPTTFSSVRSGRRPELGGSCPQKGFEGTQSALPKV